MQFFFSLLSIFFFAMLPIDFNIFRWSSCNSMWPGSITKRHRTGRDYRQFIDPWWWFVAEIPLPRWRITGTKYTLECIGRTIMSWQMVTFNRWPTEKMYRITVHFYLKERKTKFFCFILLFVYFFFFYFFRLKIAFKFSKRVKERMWKMENKNSKSKAKSKAKSKEIEIVFMFILLVLIKK